MTNFLIRDKLSKKLAKCNLMKFTTPFKGKLGTWRSTPKNNTRKIFGNNIHVRAPMLDTQ